MATQPFSMRLDAQVKKRLQKEAKLRKRSAGFIVQQALEEYLKGKDFERRMAEEAFVKAEKGVFISGEKVHAWMESLGTENELPFPEPDIFPGKTPALSKVG
jgi:predicted transcriptional regulator